MRRVAVAAIASASPSAGSDADCPHWTTDEFRSEAEKWRGPTLEVQGALDYEITADGKVFGESSQLGAMTYFPAVALSASTSACRGKLLPSFDNIAISDEASVCLPALTKIFARLSR